MSKYIDAEESKKILYSVMPENPALAITLQMVIELFDALPTADVEPVKHGHWIEHQKTVYLSSSPNPNPLSGITIPDYYECSLCGRHEKFTPPYCNCGAKMDEEENEE